MKRAIAAILIIIIILVGGGAGWYLYNERYGLSTEKADTAAYFGVSGEDDYPVVLQDALNQDLRVKKIDGAYYMKLTDVRSLLNRHFYYDEADGAVYYCLPESRQEFPLGAKTWTTDGGSEKSEEHAPAVQSGEEVWLSLDFLKNYANFSFRAFEHPNHALLYTKWPEREVSEVKRDSQIRTTGGVKSPILTQVKEGEQVVVLEQMDRWSKVVSENAYIGYIQNSAISSPKKQTPKAVTRYQEPDFTHLSMDEKVNLAWHSISVADGNDQIGTLLSETRGINVVSPTWFIITDESGTMQSLASKEYVAQMHAQDRMVWAQISNFTSGTTYREFLRSGSARAGVIGTLMSSAQANGFDGINVDFEDLGSGDGQNFVEFIRELSIACRKASLYLSVDNYVPYNFNDYYDLHEQAVYADYVILMGYDEHYGGDQNPGSVASLPYVKYGIKEALREVPKEQLINGIPFYTRIWITEKDGTVKSQAVGMHDVQSFLSRHGLSAQWDEESGQNYAETTENGVKYQVWIEDAKSIGEKLAVMQKYSLAGVAEWNLGFESADVWDEIQSYLDS